MRGIVDTPAVPTYLSEASAVGSYVVNSYEKETDTFTETYLYWFPENYFGMEKTGSLQLTLNESAWETKYSLGVADIGKTVPLGGKRDDWKQEYRRLERKGSGFAVYTLLGPQPGTRFVGETPEALVCPAQYEQNGEYCIDFSTESTQHNGATITAIDYQERTEKDTILTFPSAAFAPNE